MRCSGHLTSSASLASMPTLGTAAAAAAAAAAASDTAGAASPGGPGLGVFAVAARDVAAGEELLYCYGLKWWLGRLRLEVRERERERVGAETPSQERGPCPRSMCGLCVESGRSCPPPPLPPLESLLEERSTPFLLAAVESWGVSQVRNSVATALTRRGLHRRVLGDTVTLAAGAAAVSVDHPVRRLLESFHELSESRLEVDPLRNTELPRRQAPFPHFFYTSTSHASFDAVRLACLSRTSRSSPPAPGLVSTGPEPTSSPPCSIAECRPGSLESSHDLPLLVPPRARRPRRRRRAGPGSWSAGGWVRWRRWPAGASTTSSSSGPPSPPSASRARAPAPSSGP